MKIITNEVENKSLDIAKSFVKELEIEFTTAIPDTDELVLYIEDLENCLFAAESLTDIFGAYDHYSKVYDNIIIVPQNHINYYKYPEPTLLNFAGGRLWRTSSNLLGTIFFGKAIDIKEILTDIGSKMFNNGIFHKGKYTIISPLPSLIVDLSEEQLPTISHQMFDVESYKEMINSFNIN